MFNCADPALAGVVSRLRIAHHIPGRVRLKLEDASAAGVSQALAGAQAFVRTLDAAQGIRSINLNVLARSCTVEYDPARIPPAAWGHVIEGVDSPEASILVGILTDRPAGPAAAIPR